MYQSDTSNLPWEIIQIQTTIFLYSPKPLTPLLHPPLGYECTLSTHESLWKENTSVFHPRYSQKLRWKTVAPYRGLTAFPSLQKKDRSLYFFLWNYWLQSATTHMYLGTNTVGIVSSGFKKSKTGFSSCAAKEVFSILTALRPEQSATQLHTHSVGTRGSSPCSKATEAPRSMRGTVSAVMLESVQLYLVSSTKTYVYLWQYSLIHS